MGNRRKFIKYLATAGIVSSMPQILFSQQTSSQTIRLLVRGDDMGKNYCRVQGFIRSYKEGVLTSASIMATGAYFYEAVNFCKKNPGLAAGIHLSLSDGTQRPVSPPEEVSSLITPRGFFYESVTEMVNPEAGEMEKEIRAQINKARASGLHFIYLDWHRGIPEGAEQIVLKICKEQKLIYGATTVMPSYGYTRVSLIPNEKFPSLTLPDGQIAYYSAPELSDEDQQAFFDALANLKPGIWYTVIHPGWVDANRASVTKLLCSSKTKEIIKQKNIKLLSYYDIWEEKFGKMKNK